MTSEVVLVDPIDVSPRHRRLPKLRGNALTVVATLFLIVLLVAALFAPWLAPMSPEKGDVRHTLAAPSLDHLLGTDRYGRDILSRLIFGARVSLLAVAQAIGVTLGLGGVAGLIAGYVGGLTDRVLGRLADATMSLPGMTMAIAIVAVLGPGLSKAMLAIGIALAPRLFRVVRAATLEVRSETYITNAETLAMPQSRIIFRHLLPNVAPAVIAQLTIMVALVLLSEASLSFLGLGAQNGTPSWGVMITEAAQTIRQTAWPLLPPGIALTLTVLASYFIGDALADRGAGRTAGPAGRQGAPSARLGQSVPGVVDEPLDAQAVVCVRNLGIEAPYEDGSRGPVVLDVSFDIHPGEVLGVIGESGSGKTVTGLALLGLLPKALHMTAQHIQLGEVDLVGLSEHEWTRQRGSSVAMIFQEPSSALTPTLTVGAQLLEVLRLHQGLTRADATAEAARLLERVGIKHASERLALYPHQLSGGMAQRVMIAIALAGKPRLLVADEPTTALDVTVQSQVLDLLRDIVDTEGMALMLITHDVGVVADIADRVAVMYAGRVVETGDVAQILTAPRHAYTEALIRSIPRSEAPDSPLTAIRGSVPPPWAWPSGCPFRDRCDYATEECTSLAVSSVPARRGNQSTVCVHADQLHTTQELVLGDRHD